MKGKEKNKELLKKNKAEKDEGEEKWSFKRIYGLGTGKKADLPFSITQEQIY